MKDTLLYIVYVIDFTPNLAYQEQLDVLMDPTFIYFLQAVKSNIIFTVENTFTL